MSITRTSELKFLFENSNGRIYTVKINTATGAGIARLQPQVDGRNVIEDYNYNNAETAVTVDAASLAAWKNYHISRKYVAAVYNTAQALNTILNAA